jgi:hypothetical protein
MDLPKLFSHVPRGTGFLSTGRTQRLIPEAASLLVWSAAPAVEMETLYRIWGVSSPDG